MWGRMKVRGLNDAKARELCKLDGGRISTVKQADEQTDDLQGFPRTLGEVAASNELLESIVFERRVPPCTGYDKDYEEVERAYSDKPGY